MDVKLREVCVRFSRILLVGLVPLVCLSVSAQQTQESTVPAQAPRDPQAIAILTQVLITAGGVSAYNAVTDYTAIGTVTANLGRPSQDSVTINGRGSNELRKDLSLGEGVTSSIVSGTLYSVQHPSSQLQVRTIQPPMMTGNLGMPHREMAYIVANSQFSLTYVGLIQDGGRSFHDIRAQFAPTGLRNSIGSVALYQTIDFLIDASTLQLGKIRDAVPRRATPRTIAYSDFRSVSGILVPFLIDEEIGGQPDSTIQLSQVTVNVGLPDSTFQLGSAAQ
jgi:hypothetical protein